jgi:hypothetical protein
MRRHLEGKAKCRDQGLIRNERDTSKPAITGLKAPPSLSSFELPVVGTLKSTPGLPYAAWDVYLGREDKKIMDTMTYASVAALPENVARSTRRLQVPEVELTPLDLSYLGKSIRAEISRLKAQLTELTDEVRRLAGLLKYLGKSRPLSENSDREKIDAELAFQRSLDRLDC